MIPIEELYEEYAKIRDVRVGIDGDVPEKRRKMHGLECVILGHPDSFARVRCWMVDVHGTRITDASGDEELLRLVGELQTHGHSAVDSIGELAAEVHRFMNQRVPVTDSGAGSDSWTYGAHCTHQEAEKLCLDLYLQYSVEIEKGVLRVERIPWSLELI